MINYGRDEAVRDAEGGRSRLSGRMKKIKRLFGFGMVPAAA
jgi:hypothetical protein